MPWVMIHSDDDDADAADIMKRALDSPVQVTLDPEGHRIGYTVVTTTPDRTTRARAQNRTRQQRYRDKRRNADERYARNADERYESQDFHSIDGEDQSVPTPKGREGLTDTPERNAALRDGALRERDAMERYALPEMSPEQRAANKESVTEIREAMRRGDL